MSAIGLSETLQAADRAADKLVADFAALQRELSRLKRLEAILRERVDTDHNDQPNAEARALMDWENGE